MNASVSLQPGALFHERYRVVCSLNAGGMGAVYEVVDERTNSPRALKVMLPSLVADPELRARFALEATVTGNIASDHIVRVSDAGLVEATGTPYLVMELLQGEELSRMLRRRGPLPPGEVLLYLHQAALALDKTHAAGIVHRDLKPENLFVTYRDDGSPCVKILDFGIAKIVAQGTARTTQAVGTPIYMAPEQIRGESAIGPRVDLFALGHIAYACLAGEPYWSEDAKAAPSVFPLLTRMVAGMPEPPAARSQRRRGVALPLAFDDWMQRAVATRQEDRFDRATEQIAALAEALGAPSAATASHGLPPGGPLIPPPVPPPAISVGLPAAPPAPGVGSGQQLTSATERAMVSAAAPVRSGAAWPAVLGAVVLGALCAAGLFAAGLRGAPAASSVGVTASPSPPEPLPTALQPPAPSSPVTPPTSAPAAPGSVPRVDASATASASASAKAPPPAKAAPRRPPSASRGAAADHLSAVMEW